MPSLVVAGVSARLLAQAAARDGFDVIALDCFGDLDTRRAAPDWRPIGDSLQIDAARLLDTLESIGRARNVTGDDKVLGWIAGSGLDGRHDALARGAGFLPLLGTPADAVRRVRDPATFFAALDAHGIDHPPVRFDRAPRTGRWLRKDAGGCGGWHIGPAHAGAPPPGGLRYFQREATGSPMSATFIADGRGTARIVGINALIVRARGAHPFVYHGCIGPVPVAAGMAQRIEHAVQRLAAEFALCGWCSLDVLIDGERVDVLEVNPRPPASLALYAARGVVDAQLRACLHGELPPPGAFATASPSGHEIVFAAHAFALGDAAAKALAARDDVHDLPAAGTRFSAGEPVCSVDARGADAAAVHTALAAARDDVLNLLETTR